MHVPGALVEQWSRFARRSVRQAAARLRNKYIVHREILTTCPAHPHHRPRIHDGHLFPRAPTPPARCAGLRRCRGEPPSIMTQVASTAPVRVLDAAGEVPPPLDAIAAGDLAGACPAWTRRTGTAVVCLRRARQFSPDVGAGVASSGCSATERWRSSRTSRPSHRPSTVPRPRGKRSEAVSRDLPIEARQIHLIEDAGLGNRLSQRRHGVWRSRSASSRAARTAGRG